MMDSIWMILAGILFFLESTVRVYQWREVTSDLLQPWRFMCYFLPIPIPLFIFWVSHGTLLLFYLAYFAMCGIQKWVSPVSKDSFSGSCRLRFVIFVSIHLCTIGVASLLLDESLHQVLSSLATMLGCMCIALCVTVALKLRPILLKSQADFIIRKDQKRDFRYLYRFFHLSIVYALIQSALCLVPDHLERGVAYLLCSNLISYILIACYVKSLMKIFQVDHAERSNSLLSHSLTETDLRLRQLRVSAHFDTLTGAHSRLYMIQEATRLLDCKELFALIYMDLNGLKKINDTYGHQAGDDYLCDFVRRTRSCIRSEDILCRFGGDEFVLLFPGCTRETAQHRLQEIRDTLGKDDQAFAFGAGVTDSTESDHLDTLIMIADQRMYMEKREGREREEYV